MITFAQTTKPVLGSTPAAAKVVVTSDSLKHDKKGTERDISVQTNPPASPSIPTAVNVEMQRRFNELRRELLDNRAADIDRWFSVVIIILTFLGIVAVLGGYISFKRFEEMKERFGEIETEAKNSATTATKHAQDAERLVGEIKKNRDESAEILQNLTAETVVDDPEEAEQAAANVGENPLASLIMRIKS